jgi:hypothetical protein
MMAAPEDSTFSSPSLVELAVIVRSEFKKSAKLGMSNHRVILKAEEVARIYYSNNEKVSANELDVLYEVLREFGIITAHVPPDFHVHVANVVKFLEVGDRTVTKSHVAGLIFSRM